MSLPMEGWQVFCDRYPGVIKAIGETRFLSQLSQLVTNIIDYESLVVMGFSQGKPPVMIYNDSDYFIDEVKNKELLNTLVLDPFYQLIRAGTADGVYRLEDIAPDEFYTSDYYQQVYKQTGLKKEVGLLIKCSEEFNVVLSLGLRNRDSVECDERCCLMNYFELIQAAVSKHFQVGKVEERTIGHQLNDIFSNFGKDFLSERECQVTQLVLQGYSTKAIAPLLEVSTETVKVYRKRIHNKLKISSQSELFSLFLEAASTVPSDSNIDPLTVYFGGQHVH
ncbi:MULTISPECIES: helix-turn-helix transcriptional regulator [Vibrio]|uniref:helix-turn-helix transcriptional regulator n=1 Tax=Vibrio TaxID=662 RepID=UPI003D0BE189